MIPPTILENPSATPRLRVTPSINGFCPRTQTPPHPRPYRHTIAGRENTLIHRRRPWMKKRDKPAPAQTANKRLQKTRNTGDTTPRTTKNNIPRTTQTAELPKAARVASQAVLSPHRDLDRKPESRNLDLTPGAPPTAHADMSRTPTTDACETGDLQVQPPEDDAPTAATKIPVTRGKNTHAYLPREIHHIGQYPADTAPRTCIPHTCPVALSPTANLDRATRQVKALSTSCAAIETKLARGRGGVTWGGRGQTTCPGPLIALLASALICACFSFY